MVDKGLSRNLDPVIKDLNKQRADLLNEIYQKLLQLEEKQTSPEANSMLNLVNLLINSDKSVNQKNWNALLTILALFPARKDIIDPQ